MEVGQVSLQRRGHVARLRKSHAIARIASNNRNTTPKRTKFA
jgi:hypothetical protein